MAGSAAMLRQEAAVTQLLRDLLTDPQLLQTRLEPRPTVEWEAQEWCPECEQYVQELILGVCLPCLEGSEWQDTSPP